MPTAQPDTNFAAVPSATYTTRGSKSSMLAIYADSYPKLKRLLNLVPDENVCEWKLRIHAPPPTWVHGSLALGRRRMPSNLTPSCPRAAQAIEDATVLGVVLARMPDRDPHSVNNVLRVYERPRKQRAETLIDLTAASDHELHLGESAAKEACDKQFAALKQ